MLERSDRWRVGRGIEFPLRIRPEGTGLVSTPPPQWAIWILKGKKHSGGTSVSIGLFSGVARKYGKLGDPNFWSAQALQGNAMNI